MHIELHGSKLGVGLLGQVSEPIVGPDISCFVAANVFRENRVPQRFERFKKRGLHGTPPPNRPDIALPLEYPALREPG
jgi:hypothetical protein